MLHIVARAEKVIAEARMARLAAVNAEMRKRLRRIVIPELKRIYKNNGIIIMMSFSSEIQDAFEVSEWTQMKIGIFPCV